MGSNLLLAAVIYLLIFVNAVISGRFPSGIGNRMSYDDDEVYDHDHQDSGSVTKPKRVLLDWADVDDVVDENDDNGFEHLREDASWEDYLNGGDGGGVDEEGTAYITDVQINELQNTQDKLRQAHQDQEAYQVDPRCPRFDGLCSAQICTSDGDCGKKICCYNGCVHTCLENQASAIDVDWIPYGSEDNVSLLSSGSSDAETITIPGGCRVSQKERHSLELFYKYGHVTKCVCMKDDVVCYVSKRDTFSSLNNEVLNSVL